MQKTQVVSIWRKNRERGLYVNFHQHHYHELVYYVSGDGHTHIGEQAFDFGDHTFAIIPCGLSHDEEHRSAGEVICLGFSAEKKLSPVFRPDPSGEILRILKELLDEVLKQNYGYREMLSVKLQELLLRLERADKTDGRERSFEYIINFLRENYHERIRLSDCAAQMNLSYDYFQHKFKRITGVSPRQFLLECRLNAARTLLLSNQWNCTEIAFRCGFSTSAQFSALFKARFGCSPLQYQKNQKG